MEIILNNFVKIVLILLLKYALCQSTPESFEIAKTKQYSFYSIAK